MQEALTSNLYTSVLEDKINCLGNTFFMFMKKYVHVSHASMEASGRESKISASKSGGHAFLFVPQCHRGKEVGLSV